MNRALKQQNQGHVRAGAGAGGRDWRRPPLPPLPENAALSAPTDAAQRKPRLATLGGDAGEDISPMCKFKDWQTFDGIVNDPPAKPNAATSKAAPAPTSVPRPAAKAASDVTALVQAAAVQAAAAVAAQSGGEPAPNSTGVAHAAASKPGAASLGAESSAGLESSLRALGNASTLALATDCLMVELLQGLRPLLAYSRCGRRWTTPSLGGLLPLVQQSCEERLRRTTLPCDATLASSAARFFARVQREAGTLAVADSLLAAAADYVRDQCRVLSGEVLASVLVLLASTRYRPAAPIPFGNRVTERLLRLHQTKPRLQLNHLADVAEALAQLRLVDGLSASPIVNLTINTARCLEGGQHLAPGQLSQLARAMQAVAIIAATTTVPPATLTAATASWHLLVVRAEGLAHEHAGAAPAPPGQGAAPACSLGTNLSLALSRMWCASRVLMAVVKATSARSFMLPDRLGLASHTAFVDHEHRTSGSGLTSAQRRVLDALNTLKVSPTKISTNVDFLDSVFQISVAVHMRVKSTGQALRTAILIRDPLRHLMRNAGSGGLGTLGAQAAQERLLEAAGWHVVALDSHTCLQLPVVTLAEELGALMMGDAKGSSLRFAA